MQLSKREFSHWWSEFLIEVFQKPSFDLVNLWLHSQVEQGVFLETEAELILEYFWNQENRIYGNIIQYLEAYGVKFLPEPH